MAIIIENVDSEGNISFSPDEDLDIRIVEKLVGGDIVDISTSARFLNIRNSNLRWALVADPDNATGRRILIDNLQLQNIDRSEFFLTDEDGAPAVNLWEGVIFKRTA